MRKDHYSTILSQIKGVVKGESDLIANLSNIMGVLKTLPGFFWVGVYIVKDNQLVLGPFQGPVACTRISKGKGVCGSSWSRKMSILVPDVSEFPGHIACNSESQSEMVVPVLNNSGEVAMVIDVDSVALNDFSEDDVQFMEQVAKIISQLL